MTYLTNLLLFSLVIIAVVTFVAVLTFMSSVVTLKDYIKSKAGEKGVASAGLGIGSILLLSLVLYFIPNNASANPFENATWFNDAGVYIGLDYTKEYSPQCGQNLLDNRGTSNLGVWGNIWQSSDNSLRVNARYTHHSCYLGPDDLNYDAAGIQVEWKVWQRKR